MMPSSVPNLAASFSAPVAAMKGMPSLSMNPGRVAQAANSGLRSPSSCKLRPRASRASITCWLCSSAKKLWISDATSRPTSGR
ncbi:hypothetical protein FQZ97_1086980 [compost metagenome]